MTAVSFDSRDVQPLLATFRDVSQLTTHHKKDPDHTSWSPTNFLFAAMSDSYTKPAPKFDLSAPNPVYKLASGVDMPVVAYGTFRSAPGEVGPAVIEAIKAGYRHLDLAHV